MGINGRVEMVRGDKRRILGSGKYGRKMMIREMEKMIVRLEGIMIGC